jgi:hypothetical protein
VVYRVQRPLNRQDELEQLFVHRDVFLRDDDVEGPPYLVLETDQRARFQRVAALLPMIFDLHGTVFVKIGVQIHYDVLEV